MKEQEGKAPCVGRGATTRRVIVIMEFGTTGTSWEVEAIAIARVKGTGSGMEKCDGGKIDFNVARAASLFSMQLHQG
jgi:hypothetical protein